MRKTLAFVVSLAMCSMAHAALKDGTYQTSTMGNNGPVMIETTIKSGIITGIEILKSQETPLLGDEALKQLSKQIVETQDLACDAISGATNSSRAMITGVETALAKAGGTPKDLKAKTKVQKDAAILEDATTDVLVVGAGGSGMAAAIEAQSRGAKVILIEKMPHVGGTTLYSTTSFTAGGSRQQLAGEKPFTPDDFHKKLLVEFPNLDSPNLRQLAERSGPTVDWLIDMGADISKVINNSQHVSPQGKALGMVVVPYLDYR